MPTLTTELMHWVFEVPSALSAELWPLCLYRHNTYLLLLVALFVLGLQRNMNLWRGKFITWGSWFLQTSNWLLLVLELPKFTAVALRLDFTSLGWINNEIGNNNRWILIYAQNVTLCLRGSITIKTGNLALILLTISWLDEFPSRAISHVARW